MLRRLRISLARASRYDIMIVITIGIPIIAAALRQPFYSACELLPLLIMQIFHMKKAISLEKERKLLYYKDKPLVYRIELGEDICIASSNGTNRIQYADIKSAAKTKNPIIMMLKGSVTLTLSKHGFIEGTAQACKEPLSNELRSRESRGKGGIRT